MIGRKVKTFWGETGEVIDWKPLQYNMCDVTVKHDLKPYPGYVCTHGSTSLRPIDGLGPLPSRAEAREAARVETLRSLKTIRAQHVRDFYKPWPGLEFGKAILGKSIDNAIAELEAD
jgi:hypothetical protein